MTNETPWTCPTCKRSVGSAFCPSCGERPLQPHDLTLRGLLTHVATTITSVDSKVVRSFRHLIFRPGSLTKAFLEGSRKPFVAALPLFLLANVLFFATQSISPLKVFSSSLDSHMHMQDWRGVAQALVARKLAATSTTLETYAPRFDRAVALNAKSLVILMIAPLLALLPLLFRRCQRPYAFHIVFALHVYAFNLVLLSALLLIVAIAAWLGHGAALTTAIGDHLLFALYLSGSAIYQFIATRVAYGTIGAPRLLQTIALTLIAGAAVVGYRFLLFLITLYST